jgi:hypothetical protein
MFLKTKRLESLRFHRRGSGIVTHRECKKPPGNYLGGFLFIVFFGESLRNVFNKTVQANVVIIFVVVWSNINLVHAHTAAFRIKEYNYITVVNLLTKAE